MLLLVLTGTAGQSYIPVASDHTSRIISHISRLGERLDSPNASVGTEVSNRKIVASTGKQTSVF
jgi:hypothetical protein